MRNGIVSGIMSDSYSRNLREIGEGFGLTRLEKVLLTREDVASHADGQERRMRVVSQEDEMWTAGMQAALEAGSMNGSEDDDEGSEDINISFGTIDTALIKL
jgi:hypothetical protein